MAGLSRVTPATLDVLEALLDGEVEPYGLAIARRAGLATGSVFPILARLERLAWITSAWEDTDRPGPRRRLYSFTPDGLAGARVLLAERRGRAAGQRHRPGGFTPAPEGAR